MTQQQQQTALPTVNRLYYSGSRDTIINRLARENPGWEFVIGARRLGEPDFRSEYPRYEIVAEYRPHLHDRLNRFAVYARKVAEAA